MLEGKNAIARICMYVCVYICAYTGVYTSSKSKRMNAVGGGITNKTGRAWNANEKEGENEIRKEKSSLNE